MTRLAPMARPWRRDRIENLIRRLHAADADERGRAADELANRAGGLSTRDGLALLTAAHDDFPPLKSPVWEDVPTALISATSADPKVEYIDVVERGFARLSVPARAAALTLVARCRSREASLAYMRLVREHLASGRITDLRHWPFLSAPRDGDVFFPELLDYATDDRFAEHILGWSLAYARAGQIDPAALRGHTDLILSVYLDRVAQLRSLQHDEPGAWMWEDDYAAKRTELGTLMDLLGFLDDARAVRELHAALRLIDPSARLWAAVALLRAGEEVDPETLDAIASWTETRTDLYLELHQLGRLDRFPGHWATHALLAEGDMVRWLAYPTELGRPPDEIDLIEVVTRRGANGETDYYVFRFRTLPPHWAATDGWQAGVAGPYPRGRLSVSPSGTFSDFQAADSRTAEEHVQAIAKIVGA
jgi:hypothetical protein